MSNHVKISVIGAAPNSGGRDLSNDAAVERMIDFWDDKLSNVLPDKPDLVVVPECCDRYSDMTVAESKDYYERRGDRLRDFFMIKARENRCFIAYSAVRETSDGRFKNTTQLIDRQGNVAGMYDKNHLTAVEIEEWKMVPGENANVIETDFGKIACVTCFDLNFDQLRVKYREQRPDLIMFCSMYHGGLMQPYWAYSCRSHFAAAVAGLKSEILNPVGEVVAKTTNYHDHATRVVNLDCQLVHLDFNSGKLKDLKAAYGPEVTIHDPGHLGSVLVSSESVEIPVKNMISEFAIETLDDYLTRSLAQRQTPHHVQSLPEPNDFS